MRNIDKIILHCSDSDIENHDDINVIKRWHLMRGFTDIGYHYVILKNGTICLGRGESEVGAHCKGHNIDSIGICLTGKNNFSERQFNALEKLLDELKERYNIKQIVGHNFYDDKKTCPNFSWGIYDIT